jgi:hypothetical protein
MIRIRGHVGELVVDLSIEMDDQDWAQMARQLPSAQEAPRRHPLPTGKQPNPYGSVPSSCCVRQDKWRDRSSWLLLKR